MLIDVLLILLILLVSLAANLFFYKKYLRTLRAKESYKKDFDRLNEQIFSIKNTISRKEEKELIASESKPLKTGQNLGVEPISNSEEPNIGESLTWDIQSNFDSRDRQPEYLFFQRPNDLGLFHVQDAVTEYAPRYIYRISVGQKGDSGELFLEAKGADLDLIRNFPERTIEAGCDYVNGFYGTFNDIKQRHPGKVVSEGSVWRIAEKIKIEFK